MNTDKRKEQNRKAAALYRQKNKEKLVQKRKDDYKKNGKILRERNNICSRKPENIIKKKKHNKEYREKNKPYRKAYHRLKQGARQKGSWRKRLDERKIEPTEQEMQWMTDVCLMYAIKFKFKKEELLGVGYEGLLQALRLKKDEEWFDLEAHVRSKVWHELINNFWGIERNKKRNKAVSLDTVLSDDFTIKDTIECKSEAENFDLKHDAKYFKKEIRKGFKKHYKNKSKYSYRDNYNIWYNQNIDKLSVQEIADKYNVTYSGMESKLFIVNKIFKEIRKKIRENNPSFY